MAELSWVPDPHNADTTDLRDASDVLRGWVYSIRPLNPGARSCRGVVCREHGLGLFEDHHTEAEARAWVEATVAGRRLLTEAAGQDERGGDG